MENTNAIWCKYLINTSLTEILKKEVKKSFFQFDYCLLEQRNLPRQNSNDYDIRLLLKIYCVYMQYIVCYQISDYFYTLKLTTKERILAVIDIWELTAPDPSVDGPPTKAIILAPEPGTQSPNKLAAILKAVLVHLDARWSAGTGQGSFWSSSRTYTSKKKKC